MAEAQKCFNELTRKKEQSKRRLRTFWEAMGKKQEQQQLQERKKKV